MKHRGERSERELNLPEMWFTGKEWVDGTAQRVYGQLYKAAHLRLEKTMTEDAQEDLQIVLRLRQEVEREAQPDRNSHRPMLPGQEHHNAIPKKSAP